MTTNKNSADDFYLEPQNFDPTSIPTSIDAIRARYAVRKAQIDAEIAAGAQARAARKDPIKTQSLPPLPLEPIIPGVNTTVKPEVTQPLPYSNSTPTTFPTYSPPPPPQIAEPVPAPTVAPAEPVTMPVEEKIVKEKTVEVESTAKTEPAKEENSLPEIVQAPVVGTQSSEMIVDLPQGQKFTLRGMSPGTIIEIASWSGSGSPDEAAIRMLFGATRDTKFEPYPVQEPKVEIQSGEEVVSLPPKKLRKDGAVSSLLLEEAAAELTPEQLQEIKRQKVKRTLVGIGVFVGSIALLIGAIFGLRAANLIYFEHPTKGITTGLGGAETSIAVVSPGAALDISSTVVAEYEGEKILAAVTAIEAGQALLITGSGQIVVPVEDITGRLLFVLPFLGVIAGWFGG